MPVQQIPRDDSGGSSGTGDQSGSGSDTGNQPSENGSGTTDNGTDTTHNGSGTTDNGIDTTHNGSGTTDNGTDTTHNGSSGHGGGGGPGDSCQGEGGRGQLYEVGGSLVCFFNGPQKNDTLENTNPAGPCENDITWGGVTDTIYHLVVGKHFKSASAFWRTQEVVNCLNYLHMNTPPPYE
ncbi:hypothetical protein AB0I54_26835 [Streptomyces sp. NPDC050625]|uniref:hypothetical protein n=1 Tax=Streptomyces sp. NPDC050625 TaxID=3154629 RepID=UPI003431ABF1